MAQLALRLQVFIASPGDVVPERDVVEEEVRVLSVEAARDGILLESYRWDTDLPYGFGRPQGRIIPALEESELFVGLLWSRLGTPSSVTSSETGFQEELRIATDRATQGQLDDVLLYFKHLPAPAADAAQWEKVQEFKRNLEESKTHFPGKFTTLDEFRPIFRKRLRDWYKHGAPCRPSARKDCCPRRRRRPRSSSAKTCSSSSAVSTTSRATRP